MKYLVLLFASSLISCATVPNLQGVIKLQDGSTAQPTLKVLVNNQEKTLTLDSGANTPYLKPLSKTSTTDVASSESTPVDVFGPTIKKFRIEKVNFKIASIESKNVKTQVSEELNLEAIPLDLIQSSQMIFDFANSEIKLGEKAEFCEPTSQFRTRKGLHYVRVRIGGFKHWLLWDTGATTSTLQESLEKKYGWVPAKEMPLNVISPTNSEQSPTKLFVEPIQINGKDESLYFVTRDLTKTFAALNDDADGILGYNFIKKYKWYFDFDKKTYCFVKN